MHRYIARDMGVDTGFSLKFESLIQCLPVMDMVLIVNVAFERSATAGHRKSVLLKGTLQCSYRTTEIAAVTVTALQGVTKVHLGLLRVACSHTCSLSLKPGQAWLGTGPTYCEKTRWHPSCHSECEMQDVPCQDEPLQRIVALQLSVRYINLPRKAFRLFPWWDELQMHGSGHFWMWFLFSSLVCTTYAR